MNFCAVLALSRKDIRPMTQKIKALYDWATQRIAAHAKWIIPSLMLLALVPFFVISIYSRPCVDDFSYSLPLHELVQSGHWNLFSLLREGVKVDLHYYQTWQGLYTSAFVLAFQPGIFGEKYYFLGAVLLLVLMALCVRYFVGVCLERLEVPFSKTLVSLIVLVAFLQGLPSTVEGLYWFNGAWNYTPFFFLILVNLALLLRYTSPKGKPHQLVLSTVLSFVVSGGNHVTSFLNILLLTLALVLYRQHQKLLPPWAAAVVGFIIMYKAPGTAMRQSLLGKSSIPGTLAASLKQSEIWLAEWSDLHWFLCMGLAFGLALAIHPPKELCLPNPLWVMAAGGALFCGELCVPYYAMSSFGEGRAQNIYWLTFMLVSAVIVIYTVVWFNQKGRPAWLDTWAAGPGWNTMLVVLAAALVFHTGTNAKDITRELLDGTAKTYATQYDSRIAAMQQLAEGETFHTTPLVHSTNLYFADVSDDPADWKNQSWAEYYGHSILADVQN